MECKIVLYSVDYVRGQTVGELSRRSLHLYDSTCFLVRYNRHVCYIKNPKLLFKLYRCPNCSHFSEHPSWIEKHTTSCQNRVKDEYPGGVYNVKETLFEKLAEHNIIIPANLQLSKNVAVLDFESYLAKPDEKLNDTERLK